MKKRRDEGVALILALLVLVILVVVVLQMSASSLHNRTVADNHLSDLQNAYGARAGYARALLYLQADAEEKPEVDTLTERWAQPIDFDLGKTQVRVTVVDADRFVNLSQLVTDKGEQNPAVVAQLRRLVKILRFTPDMADRIIDYIDADNKGEFESKARNDRLYNGEELLRIDGLPAEVLYGGIVDGEERKGLREFITIWPRTAPPEGGTPPGAVNVNTASSEVLQTLSEQMTVPMAEAIVAFRTLPAPDGRPQQFEKVDDLKRVQGMSDGLYADISGKVTVKSSTFEVRVRGTVGKVEKTWVYVVSRKASSAAPAAGGGTTPPTPPPSGSQPGTPAAGAPSAGPTLQLIGSQMMNDFASIRPAALEK